MIDFEPRIIAFCCNWCSYAGADLAGISRLHYPTNIRIIRVMCSGRVETGFVLKAFERGADGVLVTGCHPGDCHYTAGNEKAEGQIAMAKELLSTLGLGSERLRLEWISSSEGQKFASTMKEFVEKVKGLGANKSSKSASALTSREVAAKAFLKTGKQSKDEARKSLDSIIVETGAYNCLDCGKCTGICPVTRTGQDYHPRNFVESVVFKERKDVVCDKSIWLCLTCALCSQYCLSGVNYPELVRELRAEAVREGNNCECTHSEILKTIPKLMTSLELQQDRLWWLDKGLKTSDNSEYIYFTGCVPYFALLFRDIGVGAEGANATIKLLNLLGIYPILLPNEKCCGHDMLWTGEVETFRKLAEKNMEMIEKTGAKKLIFSCPECYRTFKLDYPRFGVAGDGAGAWNLETYHISEIVAKGIQEGKLMFKETEERVTYQDPCRLGRHLGIYEPPRKLFSAVPGLKFSEMQRNRERGLCCGTSCWISCGTYSKQHQVERLKEAKLVADKVITACLHCEIHFKCAMHEDEPEVNIGVEDLSVFAMKSLKLKEGD